MQPEYSTNKKPNAETLKSINELEDGNGELFTGSTEELFKLLTESSRQTEYSILQSMLLIRKSSV